MAAIKMVETLPEGIVEHRHFRETTELDLSGAQLISLPERLCECTQLTTLDLSRCEKLVSLPAGTSHIALVLMYVKAY